MADRQRLIAVCLSQVQNLLNTGFLNELGRVAAAEDCGVAVFNTSLDFYWYQNENKVPRAVYRAIRYDLRWMVHLGDRGRQGDVIYLLCG